uniref:Uncharacterized protein n=1 Tax=Glossina austeni TaxID=7395 RepID=A0A1A9UPC4_GLOAU
MYIFEFLQQQINEMFAKLILKISSTTNNSAECDYIQIFHNIMMSSHKICRRLGTSRAVQLNNMFILAHRLSVPLLSLLSGRLTGRVTGWLTRWFVADNQCVVCYSILSFKTVGGA